MAKVASSRPYAAGKDGGAGARRRAGAGEEAPVAGGAAPTTPGKRPRKVPPPRFEDAASPRRSRKARPVGAGAGEGAGEGEGVEEQEQGAEGNHAQQQVHEASHAQLRRSPRRSSIGPEPVPVLLPPPRPFVPRQSRSLSRSKSRSVSRSKSPLRLRRDEPSADGAASRPSLISSAGSVLSSQLAASNRRQGELWNWVRAWISQSFIPSTVELTHKTVNSAKSLLTALSGKRARVQDERAGVPVPAHDENADTDGNQMHFHAEDDAMQMLVDELDHEPVPCEQPTEQPPYVPVPVPAAAAAPPVNILAGTIEARLTEIVLFLARCTHDTPLAAIYAHLAEFFELKGAAVLNFTERQLVLSVCRQYLLEPAASAAGPVGVGVGAGMPMVQRAVAVRAPVRFKAPRLEDVVAHVDEDAHPVAPPTPVYATPRRAALRTPARKGQQHVLSPERTLSLLESMLSGAAASSLVPARPRVAESSALVAAEALVAQRIDEARRRSDEERREAERLRARVHELERDLQEEKAMKLALLSSTKAQAQPAFDFGAGPDAGVRVPLARAFPAAAGAGGLAVGTPAVTAQPPLPALKPDAPKLFTTEELRPFSSKPEESKPFSFKPEEPKPFSFKPEEPKPFASNAEAPKPFAFKPEEPKPFTFKPEEPKPFAPNTEEPKLFAFKPEESKPFASHTEEPKLFTFKPEESKPFAAKAEEPAPFAPKPDGLSVFGFKPEGPKLSLFKPEEPKLPAFGAAEKADVPKAFGLGLPARDGAAGPVLGRAEETPAKGEQPALFTFGAPSAKKPFSFAAPEPATGATGGEQPAVGGFGFAPVTGAEPKPLFAFGGGAPETKGAAPGASVFGFPGTGVPAFAFGKPEGQSPSVFGGALGASPFTFGPSGAAAGAGAGAGDPFAAVFSGASAFGAPSTGAATPTGGFSIGSAGADAPVPGNRSISQARRRTRR